LYSAIQREGRRLYELARQGISVDVPPRWVDIYRLCIVEWTPPVVHLDVECGPGTYIRALARDLGAALGCGAHLAALRRTRSGQFAVEEALSLERIEEAFRAGSGGELLHPLDVAFAHLPALRLDADEARRLAMGQQLRDADGAWEPPAGECLEARAYGPGDQFVALVFRDANDAPWRPRKVFVRPKDIA
jgi:tRNA pseudouridine55 synthase